VRLSDHDSKPVAVRISTHPWTDVSIDAEGRATEGSLILIKRSNQSDFARNVGRHPWKWRAWSTLAWKESVRTLGTSGVPVGRPPLEVWHCCHSWKVLRDKKKKPELGISTILPVGT
jgi:hypothetical protein